MTVKKFLRKSQALLQPFKKITREWLLAHLVQTGRSLHTLPVSQSRTRLYLHIGLHKTGTSAIQKFLRAHANILLEQGIYYPPDLTAEDAHHGFASVFLRNNPIGHIETIKKWVTDCNLFCQTHRLHLLLSSEVLSEPLRYETLADVLGDFDINIIIYIRRQDLLIESVMNQVLKGSQIVYSDEDFLSPDKIYFANHAERIQKWRETFPNCTIIVRRYGIETNSVETDFLNLLQLPAGQESYWRPGLVNESLGLYEFIVLRDLVQHKKITSRESFEQTRAKLKAIMQTEKIKDKKMVGNYLNDEVRQKIYALYADSNEQIRSEFFPEDPHLFSPVITPAIKAEEKMIAQLKSKLFVELSKEQNS